MGVSRFSAPAYKWKWYCIILALAVLGLLTRSARGECKPGWNGTLFRVEPTSLTEDTLAEYESNVILESRTKVKYPSLSEKALAKWNYWPLDYEKTERFEVRDYFFADFHSIIRIPKTGLYKFYLSSDDGSSMYLDGERIILFDGIHGSEVRTTETTLDRGQHDIEVKYFEKDGATTLLVHWQWADSGEAPDGLSVKTLLTDKWVCHWIPPTTRKQVLPVQRAVRVVG